MQYSRVPGLHSSGGKDLPAQYLAAEDCKEAVTPHAQGPDLVAEGHARLDVPPPGPGVGLGVCQPLSQKEQKVAEGVRDKTAGLPSSEDWVELLRARGNPSSPQIIPRKMHCAGLYASLGPREMSLSTNPRFQIQSPCYCPFYQASPRKILFYITLTFLVWQSPLIHPLLTTPNSEPQQPVPTNLASQC